MIDQLAFPPLQVRGPRARWEATGEGDPVRRLVEVCHGAGTLGEVFYAAYQLAITRVVREGPGALLVTEAAGNHPRAIEASLVDRRVWGRKRFAIRDVDAWHVLVRVGEPDVRGRADLRVATVDPGGEGVRCEPRSLGLLPDVEHVEVEFVGAPVVGELIPDAWSQVVRPFRVHEDACLTGGLCVALASDTDDDRWLALAQASLDLLSGELVGPAAERVVAGLHALVTHLLGDVPPAGPLAAHWARDAALLGLGARPRALRAALAREAWGHLSAR